MTPERIAQLKRLARRQINYDDDLICEAILEVDALRRSGLDISPCMACGLPVVCLPDGLTMCEDCARKENQS
jgi:hypothetical protein